MELKKLTPEELLAKAKEALSKEQYEIFIKEYFVYIAVQK